MIAALEGAPGVGKSTLTRALREAGVGIVPEVNQLFARPVPEPTDWYLDRQNARWEMAMYAAAEGGIAVLDGDPLQPLWFGWIFPAESWAGPAEVARCFAERLEARRMRFPDRYVLLVAEETERARRLLDRELARGASAQKAQAKVARYASFAGAQQRYFNALAERFPDGIAVIDAARPHLASDVLHLLRQPAPVIDGSAALTFAADWIGANAQLPGA